MLFQKIKSAIPNRIKKSFKSLFVRKNKKTPPYFISVFDKVSQNSFFLWLRKDSFMEPKIKNHGLYGDWEKESLKLWANLSKNANLILDIGANTGIFSILAAVNNPKSQIYAIEPIDINYNILIKNINKNNLRNIKTSKVAMSNKNGVAKMFMLKDRLNYMTSINLDRYTNSPWFNNPDIIEVEIPIISYADFKEKHGFKEIDLVKIDVEEHELQVVESMLPDIKKYRPNLLIEIIGNDQAKAIETMLHEIDYTIIAVHEKKPSEIVTKIWDNDHHNFLFCNKESLKNIQHLLVNQSYEF